MNHAGWKVGGKGLETQEDETGVNEGDPHRLTATVVMAVEPAVTITPQNALELRLPILVGHLIIGAAAAAVEEDAGDDRGGRRRR